ncbi:MAG: hypothetical protein ACOYL6_01200 [Bacteriovoracaceae bacterium]
MHKWLFLLLIFSLASFAQEAEVTPIPVEKTQVEKEAENINFDSLKKVLKNDLLDKEVKKKVDIVQQIKVENKEKELQRFFYPVKEDFWSFFSELWLVKNIQDLKWDFEKPDYGLNEAVMNLFRSHGFLEKRIKILIINSPHLSHLGLPANGNESIYLISLPFIRSMDLSKQEIAMIILEDYLRLESGLLEKYIISKDLTESFGKSYAGKNIDQKVLNITLDKLTEFTLKKGFTFQEQFDITKKMDTLLKSNQQNWNTYIQLLNKMDKLVKMNLIFESHIKLYPSPEMQIKWLSPAKNPIP